MSDLKKRIIGRVADDLTEIEAELAKNLTPHLDLVGEVAGHILFAGGKRLRPLLMVLSARMCGYAGTRDKQFSTIFEYLHAATLLHDDLVDDAVLRRGKPVAHSVYGNPAAVLTGDFLLARSLSIAAETENPRIIKIIAKITEDMSQGEIHQLLNKGKIDLSTEEYMDVIQRKTAVLIMGACRSGALVAGAPAEQEEALDSFGYHLGIAFQMVDDLLDYTADTAALGKEVGADLREGKLTMPIIHALENASSPHRKRMEEIILEKDFSPEMFEEFLSLLTRYNGISHTRAKAVEHVETAKAALGVFAPCEAKETLTMLADYALERKV